MNFQGQILKLPYIRNIWPHRKNIKECEFFGWINILFVDKIWSTFCFHDMLQCRPDVTFLSMVTLIWSYLNCDGDWVYLRQNTSLSAIFGFYFIYTPTIYEIYAILCNKITKMCELLFMIYYICLKIIETQTGWWIDGTRRDHTIWSRVKNGTWWIDTEL